MAPALRSNDRTSFFTRVRFDTSRERQTIMPRHSRTESDGTCTFGTASSANARASFRASIRSFLRLQR